MRSEILQAVVTVVAIMNPFGTAPIFQNMVSPLSPARQRAAAISVCVFILAVLLGAAFIGTFLLRLFGISIDAFRAAGGVLIGLMGFEMVRGQRSKEHEKLASESEIREQVLVPFAMPIVAGPGTIATIITLSADAEAAVPWVALLAVIAGVLVTAACLFGTLFFGRYLSKDAQRIFTRFMGLILMAMGMQFLLAGAGAVMERSAKAASGESVAAVPAEAMPAEAAPESSPR